MDKVAKYQALLVEYLEQLAQERNAALGGTPDCQVLADTRNNHFQLTRIGWHDRKYHFAVLLHLDIKPDGKIWIQQNNTEILVGEELMDRGVPSSDIVVGFRPEYMRSMSGFATA